MQNQEMQFSSCCCWICRSLASRKPQISMTLKTLANHLPVHFDDNDELRGALYLLSISITFSPTIRLSMASSRSLTALARTRLSTSTISTPLCSRITSQTHAATFSTSAPRSATPSGPPTPGFRLPRQPRWDESKESALDKAGKYFLLTEMARGMYVVLEQFFRPPYVVHWNN